MRSIDLGKARKMAAILEMALITVLFELQADEATIKRYINSVTDIREIKEVDHVVKHFRSSVDSELTRTIHAEVRSRWEQLANEQVEQLSNPPDARDFYDNLAPGGSAAQKRAWDIYMQLVRKWTARMTIPEEGKDLLQWTGSSSKERLAVLEKMYELA